MSRTFNFPVHIKSQVHKITTTTDSDKVRFQEILWGIQRINCNISFQKNSFWVFDNDVDQYITLTNDKEELENKTQVIVTPKGEKPSCYTCPGHTCGNIPQK